jgi:hypothetical protein
MWSLIDVLGAARAAFASIDRETLYDVVRDAIDPDRRRLDMITVATAVVVSVLTHLLQEPS